LVGALIVPCVSRSGPRATGTRTDAIGHVVTPGWQNPHDGQAPDVAVSAMNGNLGATGRLNATSFAAMRALDIREALAFDGDFLAATDAGLKSRATVVARPEHCLHCERLM
jgi:hypothetical protein